MPSPSLLVIGGGASGLMAAISAGRAGARVTVLERLEKAGKKILNTGNGCCNLTNTRQGSSHYHGAPPAFTDSVLRRFSPAQTMEFFNDLGLPCVEEEEGRVYPACGQASAVADVLRFELDRLNVRFHGGTEIHRLTALKPGFKAETKDGRSFTADRVIMAAGGKAASHLGSNGSGLEIATGLGHRCVGPFPALVQLNLDAPFLKAVDGVRFQGAAAVISKGRVVREEAGEILFTSYGVSGIPVLQVSRWAAQNLERGEPVDLELRFFPGRSLADIERDIRERLDRRGNETLERALIGLVPREVIAPLIHVSGQKNIHLPCRQCSPESARRISSLLGSWRMRVTGTQPWHRAQVTAGGIDSSEIDSLRLESKFVPGLFLAGEMIDVDGDCGGYNLQWAWSSGFVAGAQAALR